MKVKLNDLIDLKIERLTYNGGRGIGRHFNFAIFVEGLTAAEDIVQVKIIQLKKNFAIGQLVKIITPSPFRIESACTYFEQCGGCQWQHINYQEQVKQKKGFLAFAIKKIDPEIKVEFIAAKNILNYRNRIQLNYKNEKLGYFKRKSHSLININKCLIADEKINDLIRNFKPLDNKDKRIEFSINRDNQNKHYPVKEKDQHNLFSQVNNEINEKLIELITQEVQDDQFNNVYDAFCGCGNITVPVKKIFKESDVIGIDYSQTNISQAKKNNEDIIYHQQKVEEYFQKNPATKDSLVILDPPRGGCNKSVFKNINQAQKIIYVSCDLSTFERDGKILIDNGFKLRKVTGLDMFPQTYHLEIMSVFSK